MNTQPKHISHAVAAILSDFLPDPEDVPEDPPADQLGRLEIPLEIVDYCPDLMREAMKDIDIERTYRAKHAGLQYYWGRSWFFDPVDPGSPRQFYLYRLNWQVHLTEGQFYHGFSRIDEGVAV